MEHSYNSSFLKSFYATVLLFCFALIISKSTSAQSLPACGVTVVDANGCASDCTVVVSEPGTVPTIIVIDGTDQFCAGETRVLTVVADDIVSVLWSTGETTMSISVDATGEYCVEITNSFGCVGEACHSVTELSLPEVNAGPDVTICVGDSATLLAVGGGQNAVYVWYQDGIVIDTAHSITVPAGTADGFTEYTVELHTTFCSYYDTDVVKVWTYSAPVAAFVRNPPGVVAVNSSVMFTDSTVGQVTDWTWSFGDGSISMLPNPTHSYSDVNVYEVTLVVSNNGCSDSISGMVDVQETVSVPNVFTPNNDGTNDLIWIDGGINAVYELTFFNRCGHQLWTGQRRVFGWDGKTSAGVDCESGTYYYVLKRNDRDTGHSYEQTGFVSLLR